MNTLRLHAESVHVKQSRTNMYAGTISNLLHDLTSVNRYAIPVLGLHETPCTNVARVMALRTFQIFFAKVLFSTLKSDHLSEIGPPELRLHEQTFSI